MKPDILSLFEGSKRELQEKLNIVLEHGRSFRIATVNSEFLLEARKNRVFRENLEKSDMRVCDGAGVAWWYCVRYGKGVLRYAGVDLAREAVRIIHKRGGVVYLVTRKNGLSTWKDVATALVHDFPGLEVRGEIMRVEVDSPMDTGIDAYNTLFRHCEKESATTKQSRKIGKKITTSFCGNITPRNDKKVLGSQQQIERIPPTLILCNFGMPEQEYFLQGLKEHGIPALMIGVGGTFDYWTGRCRRAPLWMRRAGLEWLWRFARDPRRMMRFMRRMM